jgi:hypothetical protein
MTQSSVQQPSNSKSKSSKPAKVVHRTGADMNAVVQKLARMRSVAAQIGPISSQTAHPPPENSKADLVSLTQVIDERLVEKKNDKSSFVSGLVRQSRDSLGALLGHDDEHNAAYKNDTEKAHDIVVVFGKALLQDQVTVEYAARLRTLAQLLSSNELNTPDVICFCGGVRNGNHIADADAGFLFFQQLCANEGISLGNTKLFVDRISRNDRKALQFVTSHIMKELVSDWLAASHETESPKDEYGMERRRPLRKKVHLHFTLLSSEYHLCNLNDVHHRSPNQSLLRPIEKLRTVDRSHEEIMSEYDDEITAFRRSLQSSTPEEKDAAVGQRQRPMINGIVDCSWSFKYSTYPYSYTSDDASAFMGRCYLLGEELLPLYINMKGVVADREFLQRDNYMMAASIRHKLVALMEDLYKTSPGLRSGLREISSKSNSDVVVDEKAARVDIVLEGATLSLGRCIDLLRPAGLHQSTVTKAEYTKALRLLDHCRHQIRTYCDPDRPLDSKEWGRMMSPSAQQQQGEAHDDDTQDGGGEI